MCSQDTGLQDHQTDLGFEAVETNVIFKDVSRRYVFTSSTTATVDRDKTRLHLAPEVDNTAAQTAAATKLNPSALRRFILDYFSTLFLPTGYPESVTPDYTAYQIYDSLQAFASSIAGLLSSRAVLQSLNVVASRSSDHSTSGLPAAGSPEAATYATILSIAQNTISNLTTIFFAARVAPRINAEVKYYRFLADIVNDAAFVLDLLAPSLPTTFDTEMLPMLSHIPLSPRVIALCTSSGLRAVCGVASSSKSVLSAHFARNNPAQLGDLNAKDGSQETVINLIGMWVGGLVVSRVDGLVATWIWMVSLLITHLSMNYMAVKSVRLRSLNRTRLHGIHAKHNMTTGRVPSVDEIGREEPVLHFRRWLASKTRLCEVMPTIRVGVPLSDFYQTSVRQPSATNDVTQTFSELRSHRKFSVHYPLAPNSNTALILLKQDARPEDQIKAYLTALQGLKTRKTESQVSKRKSLVHSASSNHHQGREEFDEYIEKLVEQLPHAGWDVDATTLDDEGYRVTFEGENQKKDI